MSAQKESAARAGEPNATPSRVIHIVHHIPRKRKSRTHQIVVKSITFAAAIMAIYGLMYMENRMIPGLIIFAISFSYLLIFAYANGGFYHAHD